MIDLIEIIKRDSVEEMEALLARCPKIDIMRCARFIIDHDSVELFKRYLGDYNAPFIWLDASAYHKATKIREYVRSRPIGYLRTREIFVRRILDDPKNESNMSRRVGAILKCGTLAEILELIERMGMDNVKASAQQHLSFLRNGNIDVINYFYDNMNLTWYDMRHSTPAAAQLFYERYKIPPTRRELTFMIRKDTMKLYRQLRDTFSVAPLQTSITLFRLCKYGEESEIREYWHEYGNVFQCLCALWERKLWKLVNVAIANPQLFRMVAERFSHNIAFIQGITFMGWQKLVTNKRVRTTMNETARKYGYWPWFAEDARKIGVFYSEKDILRAIELRGNRLWVHKM